MAARGSFEDAGNGTRNDRKVPAYVLVTFFLVVGCIGIIDVVIDLENEGLGSGLAGEDGKLGREGVRSSRNSFVDWPSIEDSVFERASIRLAFLVGDGGGDFDGIMSSKRAERSRMGLDGDGCGRGGIAFLEDFRGFN